MCFLVFIFFLDTLSMHKIHAVGKNFYFRRNAMLMTLEVLKCLGVEVLKFLAAER